MLKSIILVFLVLLFLSLNIQAQRTYSPEKLSTASPDEVNVLMEKAMKTGKTYPGIQLTARF